MPTANNSTIAWASRLSCGITASAPRPHTPALNTRVTQYLRSQREGVWLVSGLR